MSAVIPLSQPFKYVSPYLEIVGNIMVSLVIYRIRVAWASARAGLLMEQQRLSTFNIRCITVWL